MRGGTEDRGNRKETETRMNDSTQFKRKIIAKNNYHRGLPAKGKPATSAARIPIHMKSWFTDPSAPRISVGEI